MTGPARARVRPSGLTVALVGSRHAAARGLTVWLEGLAPRGARGAVAIALVSDARIRALNRTFLGHDAVTDVLSFPAHDAARQAIDTSGLSDFGPVARHLSDGAAPDPHLGDVAIAVGRAARQARDHGHALAVELRILALHGLLHLLGYDHERDQGDMRRLEDRLRRRGGVPSGLIARTTRRPSR